MALIQQLLGNTGAAGGPGAAAGGAAFPGLFGAAGAGGMPGGMPGAQGAAGMPGGFPGLFGGAGAGGEKKKATDAFFTDRLPLLQKIKRPVLVAFFAYCFYMGWIGRFGFLQGAMSGSYFDMLAVPLRVRPESPIQGKAFFVTQIWVDSGSRLLGFLINLARGKAKTPTLQDLIPKPPGAGGAANPFGGAGASPFGAAAGGAGPFGAAG